MKNLPIVLAILYSAIKPVIADCRDPHFTANHLSFYCTDEVSQIDFEYIDLIDQDIERFNRANKDLAKFVYDRYHHSVYDNSLRDQDNILKIQDEPRFGNEDVTSGDE